MQAARSEKGLYIAFEGPDCCGKGTQSLPFLKWLSESFPRERIIPVREPGGTPTGEKMREILLTRTPSGEKELNDRASLLLFMAGRAQLFDEIIFPHLNSGSILFTERYFLSSLIYQGLAMGIDQSIIHGLIDFAVNSYWPDRTYVFDITAEETMRRVEDRIARGKADRLDIKPREFHQKVRNGYSMYANKHFDKIEIIDAMRTPEEIQNEVRLNFLYFMNAKDRITNEEFLKLKEKAPVQQGFFDEINRKQNLLYVPPPS